MRKPVANPKVYRPRDADAFGAHYVYRLFDQAGVLLYIGVCKDVDHRVYMHMRTTTMCDSWEILTCYDSHTSKRYPTKLAARDAERKAIRDEAPLFNRQHNPKRWRRQASGWVPVDNGDGLDSTPSMRRGFKRFSYAPLTEALATISDRAL